jgi:hypothetical protein
MNTFFVLSFIVFLWIIVLNRIHHVSFYHLFFSFISGVASYYALLYSYFILIILFKISHMVFQVSLEELYKFLPCYFYLTRYEKSKYSSIIFGSYTGLGFSYIENIYYMGSVELVVFRAIFSIVHILSTSISSYGVWMSKTNNDRRWLLMIIISILIHYLWNIIFIHY